MVVVAAYVAVEVEVALLLALVVRLVAKLGTCRASLAAVVAVALATEREEELVEGAVVVLHIHGLHQPCCHCWRPEITASLWLQRTRMHRRHWGQMLLC